MTDRREPDRREPADAVAELVAVMDRLRSPGGCPWDAEQTHSSLLRYAVEEVHEVVEAVEAGDRAGMREELGDLLLQVVFHARVAQEHPEDPFDLTDVADGITAKLRRRHPHVFGDQAAATSAEDVHDRWERLKAEEKRRVSALDGVPATLPALARAQKVLGRASRAGLVDERAARMHRLDGAESARPAGHPGAPLVDDGAAGTALGERLLALVAEAERTGLDAEAELRATVRALEARLRHLERGGAAPEPRPGSGLSPTSPGSEDDAV